MHANKNDELANIIYLKETSTKTNEIPVMQAMLVSMDINNAAITADAPRSGQSELFLVGGNLLPVVGLKSNLQGIFLNLLAEPELST